MSYRSIFKECLKELDNSRLSAKNLLEKRKLEVYSVIPRIKEIDDTLATNGVLMAKEILTQSPSIDNYIQDLENKSHILLEERNQLLKSHNYGDDYFTNIYKCNLCKDTGYIEQNKCNCLKQKLINKYYDLSNIRNIIREENFENFDLRFYSEEIDPNHGISPQANIQRIFQICNEFTANFDKNFSNLLFYGDTGLGKTFLCNCIAKDILDSGHTVLYVTAPQLFKVFEDYRFNRDNTYEPDDYIEMVSAVDLLIIDDLGTEFSTVISSSELFNIINTRILEKRQTVISTNLSPNDFETVYSERIISRFIGNYMMMKFFGRDIRVLKKYTKL